MNEKELYEQRLAFISNPNNKEEMEKLKKEYTFHACKFADNMDRWFDLWRKPIKTKY